VADSGEGRWTVAEAIELGVPASVITLSLLETPAFPATPIRSPTSCCRPLRNQFGGHAIKEE